MASENVSKCAKSFEQKTLEMFEQLDRSHLRKLQRRTYECCTRCCDDENSSQEALQSCISRCAVPLEKAQHELNSEAKALQDRLQRCLQTCSDRVQDSMTSATVGDTERREFDNCATECFSRYTALMPSLLTRLRSSFDSYI